MKEVLRSTRGSHAAVLLLLSLSALAAVPFAHAGSTPALDSFNFLPDLSGYCEPWDNCGIYDVNKYTCLNGVLCPLGYSRCGPDEDNYACYRDAADAPGVVPAFSCQNNKLVQTLFNGPSDGTQVTRCVENNIGAKAYWIWNIDSLVAYYNPPVKGCTPWANCGPAGSYNEQAYDCINGVLCPETYSRCGFYNDNFQCYKRANDSKNSNNATYSCVDNQLIPVPGIDDATSFTKCQEDLIPCAPYDSCGAHDPSQFTCYAGILGPSGYCRCGGDALGYSWLGYFLKNTYGDTQKLVCVNGALQAQSQQHQTSDGSEVCFCQKSTQPTPANKVTNATQCPLWTDCPGLWDRTAYDCLNGQLCPIGYSRCGVNTCYLKGAVYSCQGGQLLPGAGQDDGTQTSRCYQGPNCTAGATPWNNCGNNGYNTSAYSCLDGALCPIGWAKCGDSNAFACFLPGSPHGVSCQNKQLVPADTKGPSDGTLITECAPNGTTPTPAPTGLTQPTCTNGTGLYTNCPGIDLTTQSCLNGEACPIGMALCGSSATQFQCYKIGGGSSCVNNKLISLPNKDDGSQTTACQPANAGCHPWTNCPVVFDPETHSCLDGALCPVGFSKCVNPTTGEYACFDPSGDPAYGCNAGNIIQLSDTLHSDNTEVDYCANAANLTKLTISNPITLNGQVCNLWTNCAGVYDFDNYWCLNGQLCPAGSYRCGPPRGPFSCYVPGGAYSCVNNALQPGGGNDDATSVGPCKTAALTYCAPWKNCGVFDKSSFACLDGKLCPLGDSRCPTNADEGYICYNPNSNFQCAYGPPITVCANAYDTLDTNLIINGDFEALTSQLNGPFITLYAVDTTDLPGWSVVASPYDKNAGSIDYVGSYWQAYSGARSLDMAGFSNGAIAQTFATTPGAYYDVTFALSKNPDNPDNTTIKVLAGDQSPQFTCSVAHAGGPRTKALMLYDLQTVTFLANTTNTTLTFAENDPREGYSYGCVLDYVSVVVSNRSKLTSDNPSGVPAKPVVPAPNCGALTPWTNCPGVWDNTTYWCLNGNLCPAGTHLCGLVGSYSCYNPSTQSCVANALVNTPNIEDQTAVNYCKPTSVCTPWSNCGTPDVDYDTKSYVCLNGRLCPAGQLACGNGYEFACYDPLAQPAYTCIKNSLVQGAVSDGSEITICQNPTSIPSGYNVERNSDYQDNTLTATGAVTNVCTGIGAKAQGPGVGLAGQTAAQCATACNNKFGCVGFELTGQNTTTTTDDCCYLKSKFQNYAGYSQGVDTYFKPTTNYALIPASNVQAQTLAQTDTINRAPPPVCNSWTNCPSSKLPLSTKCFDGQVCPVNYQKCGGATFGSNNYHCYLPAPFGGPLAGTQQVATSQVYSCQQNTLTLGTGASKSDATPVGPCVSAASQNCIPWTNCKPFDPRAYACMNQLACPLGMLNCQNACYDPKVFACAPTGLTQNLTLDDPLSSTGPCNTGGAKDVALPTTPNCPGGQSPWANCAAATAQYWCVNGQNCLVGFQKCGTSCYDPRLYGCQGGALVQPDAKGNIVSDGSQVTACGPTALINSQKNLAKPPEATVVCSNSLWTNCAGQYDPKVYWCLNGQVCARGLYRCGSSCYDPKNYGCVAGVLTAAGDLTTDGSEVVACMAATVQFTLTITNNNGVFSNADQQKIAAALSNHAGASDPTAVSVALFQLDINGQFDIAKVGVPVSAWQTQGIFALNAEIGKIAAAIGGGATFTVTALNPPPPPPPPPANRRRTLLQTSDGSSTLSVAIDLHSANQTAAGPLALSLQSALAPGGTLSTALATSGIQVANITVAPSVDGSDVLATVTVPVKGSDDAQALLANITQLVQSGQLDSELQAAGLTGSVGTGVQVSILSLTPSPGANITIDPNVTAPAPSPAEAPLAPNTTKKSAAGSLRADFVTGALTLLVALLIGVAGLF